MGSAWFRLEKDAAKIVGIRVLQVAESLEPRFGGTAVAIRQLINELTAHGVDVTILLLEPLAGDCSLHPRVRICVCNSLIGRRLGFAFQLQQDLASRANVDVVHIHGLWRLHYTQIARVAQKEGVPVVLSTHGMLEKPALQHHGLRKRMARTLYQDRILRGVQCLHATTTLEADTLHRFGFGTDVAVIPWGIDIPFARKATLMPTSNARSRRIAFFLSRFHPIKGLDLLLAAWTAVERDFPQWDLVLAGYDENGYRMQVEDLARSLGIKHRVIFRGPLRGDEKDTAFAEAELFLMTSRSENFGLAIGEAMARGLPVITTTSTPWSSIGDWGCGWYVEPNVQDIVQALNESLGQPSSRLREMGQRARELVAKKFSVASAGEAMLDLYSWLAKHGPRPKFIRRD